LAQKFVTKMPTILPIFVDKEKIENAPITTDLKKKYPQWDFIILMASRLTKEKNIPLALSAMKKITAEYPKVGLVVVGEGPEENFLKILVKNSGLERNVAFETWQGDLASYYKTAHLFLLTSDYEGYGMTIVEALSAHCPTISTDVGIASDVLVDGDSFVCPVRDADCLFKKAKLFIENNNLRETFTHEALERLSKVTCASKAEYLERYKASLENIA
jgi:glycosyltransferase involved in cell wall biosynthesis